MACSPLRLIDANANRAREAARTLEDAARFLLGDADLAAGCKTLRHDLAQTLSSFPMLAAFAARDVRGDVGTHLRTASEYQRHSVRDVVVAAGKRLTEALRVLEEYGKVVAPEAGPKLEALRYRAYDLEARLVLALSGRGRQWRLCVLITEALCTVHDWQAVARQAVEGGADCLQLREKSLSDGEIVSRARWLVEMAAGRADVVVNDRVDLALASGAAGVHLGQEDLAPRDARAIAGDRLLIGVSTSSLPEARTAVLAGADLVGLGPMFPTTTKKKDHIVGPGLIREVEEAEPALGIPYLAIGGINEENVGRLASAGCRGLAVCGAVCGSKAPAEACRVLLETLSRPASLS